MANPDGIGFVAASDNPPLIFPSVPQLKIRCLYIDADLALLLQRAPVANELTGGGSNALGELFARGRCDVDDNPGEG